VHQLKERYQIKALMNAIRNSKFRRENLLRVPKLTSVFLARSLDVLMDPKHILYGKVNSFFLQRPLLDLEDIPMFYTLSNSGEHFEREVDWLLNTIIAGFDDASVSLLKLVLDRRCLWCWVEDM
jgi:Nucleolar pre-ribosomal-associated protein 1